MANTLLLYFAIPVAIVILSIIFETLIHSPIKIAGIVFSIFLIVTFAIGDETLLIFTILYTILAYIVAWITQQWINNQDRENCCCISTPEVNANYLEQLVQNTNEQTTQNIQNQSSNNYGCNRRRLF